MRVFALLISLVLSLSNAAWAGPSDTEHKPMHGGVLVIVKDIDYELVVNTTTLRLYIRDHGKPVDLSKSSAKLTLLTGTEKQEIDLKANGEKLEAMGRFRVSSGTKVVAVISTGSKPVTARFVIK